MNDDFSDLERELKRMRPVPPSARLEDAILLALSSRSPQKRSWRQRSDFLRLASSFGWSIATAAAVAVLATAITHTLSRNVPPQASATVASAPARGYETAQASNVVYETDDEGVVYTSSRQPARRVRYRSEDTLKWKNPRTGAQLQVSYPREEVVLVPIAMQ